MHAPRAPACCRPILLLPPCAQVGDHVVPGDVFCEVETDKASVAWESQEEGYLAQVGCARPAVPRAPVGWKGVPCWKRGCGF